jgi:hypothetical protein
MRLIIPMIVIGLALLAAESEEVPLSEYSCYRTPGEIIIDGRLDEDAWQAAPETGNFPLYSGKEESPVFTNAKLLWDDEYLYVCFICEDEDIYATMKERDDLLWSQDVVEVFIMEQSLDQGHFVEYEVSPIGTIFDMYLILPLEGFLEWNSPGFKCAATFDGTINDPSDKDRGYQVEMAIPFEDAYLRKAVAAPPKDGSSMRIGLYRADYECPEKMGDPGAGGTYITWSPTIKSFFQTPSRFGVVTFIDQPAKKAETGA